MTTDIDGMYETLTEDAFLGGRVTLLQPKDGPRAGLDAVFLAAACRLDEHRTTVLDAGAGVGAVSMCAGWRGRNAQITGVEIDPRLAELFRRNAARNGMEGRAGVVEGDLTQPFRHFEQQGLRANSFEHVVSNPPFFTAGQVRAPRSALTQRAHIATAGELDLWLKFLAACAAPRGRLSLIHLATALPDLLKAVEGRFGALSVFPLFPREGAPAIRVIVQGEKGSRAPMSIKRGMILHGSDGAFTLEAKAILRDGASLEID